MRSSFGDGGRSKMPHISIPAKDLKDARARAKRHLVGNTTITKVKLESTTKIYRVDFKFKEPKRKR